MIGKFGKTLEEYREETKAWKKKYARVKCDCGHYMKDHYDEWGACNKCGCTWYWPNVRYIRRQKKKEAE